MRAVAPIDVEQSLENLKLERDAIVLYDALAAIEKDPRRAAAFGRIAGNERRHADIWASKLRELGADVPAPDGPRLRVRFIILAARLLGTGAVADLVKALEGDEEDAYDAQGAVARGRGDRRRRARARRDLGSTQGRRRRSPRRPTRAATACAIAGRARSAAEIGRRESWHRAGGRSGTLRAVIFGVSDGLVSNLSLVMGVAGAASGNPSFILLAGIAGLLAGAFSMAAGEYISMQSQRELFERQIALERAEMEAMPEEEEAELAGLYRAKGFTASRGGTDRPPDLRGPRDGARHARPRGARARSRPARVALAAPPPGRSSRSRSAPRSRSSRTSSVAARRSSLVSLGLSLVALFAVGAGGQPADRRGACCSPASASSRIGLGAALVTYAIGSLIGVTTAA